MIAAVTRWLGYAEAREWVCAPGVKISDGDWLERTRPAGWKHPARFLVLQADAPLEFAPEAQPRIQYRAE